MLLQVICLKDSYVYIMQQDAPHKDKVKSGCQPYALTALQPQDNSWYSLLLETKYERHLYCNEAYG
jgi:hypothetical protein